MTPPNQRGADMANKKDNSSPATMFSEKTPEGAARTVSQVFGEIAWLFTQSPNHKNLYVSDLESRVMVPVILQQFRLFYDQQKPVGVLFWAMANDETAKRIEAGEKRLRPQDWKSGDKIKLVEVIAPFGGSKEMVNDWQTKT
jgi:cytolysin-activating lysine-acyltransferase